MPDEPKKHIKVTVKVGHKLPNRTPQADVNAAQLRHGPFSRIEDDLGLSTFVIELFDLSTIMQGGIQDAAGHGVVGYRDPFYLTPDININAGSSTRDAPNDWPDNHPNAQIIFSQATSPTGPWDPLGGMNFDVSITTQADAISAFEMVRGYLSLIDPSNAFQLDRINKALLYQESDQFHDWNLRGVYPIDPTFWADVDMIDTSTAGPPVTYRKMPSRWELPFAHGDAYGVLVKAGGRTLRPGVGHSEWKVKPKGSSVQESHEVVGWDGTTGGHYADYWAPGILKSKLGGGASVAVESPGVFFEAFDPRDTTNFKVTDEPSFGAPETGGPHLSTSGNRVYMVPKWWKYTLDFDVYLVCAIGTGVLSNRSITSVGNPVHLDTFSIPVSVRHISVTGYKKALTRPTFVQQRGQASGNPVADTVIGGPAYYDLCAIYARSLGAAFGEAAWANNWGVVISSGLGPSEIGNPNDIGNWFNHQLPNIDPASPYAWVNNYFDVTISPGYQSACFPSFSEFAPFVAGNNVQIPIGTAFLNFGALSQQDRDTIAAWLESSAGYKDWWNNLLYADVLGLSASVPATTAQTFIPNPGDRTNGPFRGEPCDFTTQNGVLGIETSGSKAGSLVAAVLTGKKKKYIWRKTDDTSPAQTVVMAIPYRSLWHNVMQSKNWVPRASSQDQSDRWPYVRFDSISTYANLYDGIRNPLTQRYILPVM